MAPTEANLLKAFSNLNPSQFLDDETSMDTIIVAKDGRKRCHKLVLAVNCLVMRYSLLDTEHLEETDVIIMPDFDLQEVEDFLSVIYGKNSSEESQCKSREILLASGFGVKAPEPKRTWKRKAKIQDDYDSDDEPLKVKKTRGRAGSRKSARPAVQTYKYKEDESDEEYYDNDPAELVELDIKQEVYEEEEQEDELDSKESCPDANCDFKSPIKEEMSKHVNENHEQFRAANNTEMSVQEILQTPKNKSERIFNCPYCMDPNDYNQKGIEKHLNDIHIVRKNHKRVEGEGVKITRESRGKLSWLTCPDEGCKWEGTTILRLLNHKIAHKKVQCPHCNKMLWPARLKKHVDNKHGGEIHVKCEQCEEVFQSQYDMKLHLKEAHGAGDFLGCPKCNKIFTKKQSLGMHMQVCAPELAPKKKFFGKRKRPIEDVDLSILDNRPDKNRCPEEGCNYYNEKHGKVRQHYWGCHIKQKCPYCPMILNVLSIERHIVHNHTKEYSYVCHICSKGYHRERELQNHIDEFHIKEVKFICPDCGKKCLSIGQYSRHKHRYHSKVNTKCEFCGKNYACKSTLKKHIIKVHNGFGLSQVEKPKSKGCVVRGEEEISGPQVLAPEVFEQEPVKQKRQKSDKNVEEHQMHDQQQPLEQNNYNEMLMRQEMNYKSLLARFQ